MKISKSNNPLYFSLVFVPNIALIPGTSFPLYFPPSIKTIEDEAFASCYKLKEVKIPTAIEEVGNKIFNNCKMLSEISFSGSQVSSKIINKIKESNENIDIVFSK